MSHWDVAMRRHEAGALKRRIREIGNLEKAGLATFDEREERQRAARRLVELGEIDGDEYCRILAGGAQ